MSHIERILVCRECGGSFTFTAGEQAFYAARGLTNQPVRCPGCRNTRRTSPSPDNSYVSYGRFASFGGRTARQMHPATCSQCGLVTEVPFLPRPERPVFCSDCFGGRREDGARRAG